MIAYRHRMQAHPADVLEYKSTLLREGENCSLESHHLISLNRTDIFAEVGAGVYSGGLDAIVKEPFHSPVFNHKLFVESRRS